jgi:hypothetical protein
MAFVPVKRDDQSARQYENLRFQIRYQAVVQIQTKQIYLEVQLDGSEVLGNGSLFL